MRIASVPPPVILAAPLRPLTHDLRHTFMEKRRTRTYEQATYVILALRVVGLLPGAAPDVALATADSPSSSAPRKLSGFRSVSPSRAGLVHTPPPAAKACSELAPNPTTASAAPSAFTRHAAVPHRHRLRPHNGGSTQTHSAPRGGRP